jgi:prepilin-type N-terminal cleavage/methylation domain-containing protein
LRRSSRSDHNVRALLADRAGYTIVEMVIVVAIAGLLMGAVFTIYQVIQRTTLRASGSEASLVQARAVVDKLGGDFRMVGAAWNFYSTSITAATATSITLNGDIDNTLDASYNPVRLTSAIVAGATSMSVSDLTNIVCGTKVTLSNGPISETHQLASSGCTSGTTVVNFQTGDTPFTSYPAGAIGSGDVTFIYTVESVNWVWDATTQKLCRKVNGTCAANATSWSDDTDVIADNVTSFCLTYLDYTGTTLNANCSAPSSSQLSSIRAVIVKITVSTKVGDQTVARQMELTARARSLTP